MSQTAESGNHSIFTNFPDSTKKIDYVLKYDKPLEIDADFIEKESYRILFLEEVKKQSIEIYNLEIKIDTKIIVYVLLNANIERLLEEAELVKLEMKLKTVNNIFLT
jgi:hypothetical protein